MANKSPSSEVSALFSGNNDAQATPDQVLTGTVQSLTGISGGSSGSSQSGALTEQLTSLTQQLQQLQTINQTQIETLQENTQALGQSSSAKAQGSGSGSSVGSIGSALLDVFGLGSGLSPLISGLMSLFGGGGTSQPAAPVPYVAPPPVNATAGISASSSGAFGVNGAAGGLPQPVPSSSTSAPSQITVQVQAMDSQSFLDHSNDIALAVRQAMLQSTVLNDVIREV